MPQQDDDRGEAGPWITVSTDSPGPLAGLGATLDAAPLLAPRGSYQRVAQPSDQGGHSTWAPDPSGPVFRSTLPGDVHAPVFDLDAPADVQAAHDGMYALVVPALKPRERIRIARRLARAGFADPAWAEEFIGTVRTRPDAGPTVLQLTVPLRAEPGLVPGHTNVYVGEAMSFARSCRLARALGGLVDAQQRASSKRNHEWRVRAPA